MLTLFALDCVLFGDLFMTVIMGLLGIAVGLFALVNFGVIVITLKEKTVWKQIVSVFFVLLPLVLVPGVLGVLAGFNVLGAASLVVAALCLGLQGLILATHSKRL